MSNSNKKKGTGINVGSISILFIFVLLCLTAFSTLSLVSANADSKLTNTAAAAMTEFYTADSNAEDTLAKIDEALKKVDATTTKQDYFRACAKAVASITGITAQSSEDNLTISYSAQISDTNEIQVALEALYPIDAQSTNRYKLTKWQAVNTLEWVGDDSLALWDGN